MRKFLTINFLLAILSFSLSGFSDFQAPAKANNASDLLGSQTNDLCWTLFKGLYKLQLTEKDRISRIDQALAEIESGRCVYCTSIVKKLLKEEDLEEGSRLREKIDDMIKHESGCTMLLLPQLISSFGYIIPVGSFDKFSKSKMYDLSNKRTYGFSTRDWKSELISATLYSNNNSDVASKYVVDILSQFAKPETLSKHIELLGTVVECNPIDEGVITAVLRQSIFMRKISLELTIKSIDEIYPSYKAELIRLNTIVEWNKYKNDNFTRVDNYGRSAWSFVPPNDWDWDEEGTIDFLNQLLVNGFTVVDEK